MKEFPFVPDQKVIATNGDPVADDITISQYTFLIGRLVAEPFIEGKTGMEGLLLVVATRHELENQKDMAAERGYWLLEDERAEAMLRAVTKGGYNMAFALTVLPFAEAVKSMKKYRPKPVAPPVEEKAEAEAS